MEGSRYCAANLRTPWVVFPIKSHVDPAAGGGDGLRRDSAADLFVEGTIRCRSRSLVWRVSYLPPSPGAPVLAPRSSPCSRGAFFCGQGEQNWLASPASTRRGRMLHGPPPAKTR